MTIPAKVHDVCHDETRSGKWPGIRRRTPRILTRISGPHDEILVGPDGFALMNDLQSFVMNRKSRRSYAERTVSMQIAPNHISRIAVITVFTAIIGTLPSQAQDRQPLETLKSQGLKRASGSTWLLTERRP